MFELPREAEYEFIFGHGLDELECNGGSIHGHLCPSGANRTSLHVHGFDALPLFGLSLRCAVELVHLIDRIRNDMCSGGCSDAGQNREYGYHDEDYGEQESDQKFQCAGFKHVCPPRRVARGPSLSLQGACRQSCRREQSTARTERWHRDPHRSQGPPSPLPRQCG